MLKKPNGLNIVLQPNFVAVNLIFSRHKHLKSSTLCLTRTALKQQKNTTLTSNRRV
jgi:hypothetical protein